MFPVVSSWVAILLVTMKEQQTAHLEIQIPLEHHTIVTCEMRKLHLMVVEILLDPLVVD
jgi:hypothetical protein